jgi:glycosyltransferase involved in cell wall biosynthesis
VHEGRETGAPLSVLLMSPERRVVRWKRHENAAARAEKPGDRLERAVVLGNVLEDVVHEGKVERPGVRPRLENVGDLEPKALVADERRGRDEFLAQLQADGARDLPVLTELVEHSSVMRSEVRDDEALEGDAALEPGYDDIAKDDALVLEVGEACREMPALLRVATGCHSATMIGSAVAIGPGQVQQTGSPLGRRSTHTGRWMAIRSSEVPRHAPVRGVVEAEPDETIDVSVVVPMHDEQDNVEPLYRALRSSLDELGRRYEIVIVDDGSRDDTYARLSRLAAEDGRLKLVKLRRNYGQTAAMAAGFDHASGEVIVPMDGDLQNDPSDIRALLEKIDEGYDVVSGWRRDRQDELTRRLPSRIANWLIGRVTGVRLHDYGCTLKAYRADVVRETRLYGEMHRFLPALAYQAGARITEIPVKHHPRPSGKSSYGLGRTFKVLLDLLTVKFLSVWSTKPSYLFGGSGAVLCLLGIGFVTWTAYEKLVNGVYVYRQPSLVVGVFLFTIGLNLILLGLLAELIVRTHHESQAKPVYLVRELRNFEAPTQAD